MAYSQHVASKHQSRRKHHTSSSENHDWEPRRDESRHSLPYRARQPEIQRPGGRRPKYSSHRPRLSEEFLDTRSMPPPVRLLTRSATEKPRSRPVYDDDDDDDDDDDEKERLRGRLRSRSRAGSLASQSSDAITIPTPTRSSYIHHRSAPPSAPSLGSISPSSSGDSESSDSTQDYRPRPRTLKERMNGTPDSEPVISPTSPGEPRRRRRDKVVLEVESLSEHSEDRAPPRHPRLVVKKSPSRHKHRHQSKSPGVALRHHRHQNRHSEGHASSSPKSPHKRYYYSDISYSERPTLSRSHTNTTSSSRMTSQSVSSSSKRSSSAFIGNFFPTRSLPAHHDKGSKTHECMVCKEDFPTSKLAKLKCGHRWCRVCLKRRFELSISDTQHMPPKCCTPDYIPLKHVNRLFNDGFKRTWNQKFAEFSARDRIHCPSKRCRELIQPNQIRHYKTGRSSATCRGCNTRICCACYNKWHESKHCPADEETVQFLKTAKEEGWQRCYKCTAMVELKEGCNHMTCRCGAEFCMICGERWKTCECPWFNYDMVEQDELDHMPMPFPMVDRDRLGGSDSFPRAPWPGSGYVHGGRPRPSIYEEPRPLRRRQEQRDEDPARRHQHADTDEDDDYLGGMGDVVGLGNAAGHFMNNDYRRRSHSMTVTPHPPPAVPPPPPSATFERTNSATNYVSGVNKARGVRGSSMERRLADRFSEQRQGPNPSHRSFGQPIPPPPPPPLSMGPPLSPQPHMGPSPVSRRHTMTDDLYDVSYNHRVPERSMPRRAATHDYMDEFVAPAPSMRRRYRDMEPPRSSELAGLTGLGSGMNRVSEWRNHVEPIGPESHTVMT